MTTDETVLYIVINAFEIEIIRRSMSIFFENPKGKFLCVFAYFLKLIIAIISHGLDNAPVDVFTSIVTIGFIAAQYEGGVKRKIIGTAFTAVLIYMCEFVVEMIFDPSANGTLLYSNSSNINALVISKLLNFMIVLIVKKAYTRKSSEISSTGDWSAVVLVPIITAVLEITVIFSTRSMMIIILSAVIVLFLNAFVFYLYDKLSENYRQKAELVKAEQERELYYNQCISMMGQQKALREFRHDINNQLEMIKILLDSGDTAGLKKQVCGLLTNDNSSGSLCFTGNIAVDGILNYKLEKIKNCGAKIETDLEIPRQAFMDIKDLTLILGNLLDNIIDALSETRSDKYCFVQIKYSKSRLLLCLKNTYENAVIYENNTIVSSKSKRDSHGIGLQSVLNVVEKYNGQMNIDHNGTLFSVGIILLLPLNDNAEDQKI